MAGIELSDLILLFILMQITMLPIQGLILFGMKREREEKDRQILELLKALRIVSVSRGNHLR